jgi:hypothetical protein
MSSISTSGASRGISLLALSTHDRIPAIPLEHLLQLSSENRQKIKPHLILGREFLSGVRALSLDWTFNPSYQFSGRPLKSLLKLFPRLDEHPQSSRLVCHA